MDTKKSTHWKDLASQLGLELPNSGELESERPAAVEPEPLSTPPVSELPATPKVAPPPARRAPSAPRARSGWSQLAAEFGIAGEEEPESIAPDKAEPVRTAYFPPERRVQEQVPRQDHDEVDRERLDIGREDLLEERDAASPPAPRERRERPPKRRGGRRRRESREPAMESAPADFFGDEDILKDIDLGDLPSSPAMDFDLEPIDVEEEAGIERESRDEDEERGRKKRRRRRRGGADRRRDEKAKAESAPEVDDTLDSDALEADAEDFADDMVDTHDEDDGHSDDTDEESDKKPSHRGIVTWEQAVGMIVKANMEMRRETRGGNDRPRSGPRGRHGGRRR